MTNEEIDNLLDHHFPQGDQAERYQFIRDSAKGMAHVIMECCPPSADRSAAIRKLRECMMTANAAIALGPATLDK